MISAVLIDDERPALQELEYLLNNYSDISIVGMYTNPMIALREIEEIKPQVIFLDINMPQIDGLELASKIVNIIPTVNIIFVTAYDTYAVEAYDLYAFDYLLKPINKKRLEKTVYRIRQQPNVDAEAQCRKLYVFCFGEFRIGWENEEPIIWKTEKTKELIAFLFHHYGKSISKHQIIDAIWPDATQEKSEQVLENELTRLKINMDEYGISGEHINLKENYCLELSDIYFDLIHFNEYSNVNILAIPTQGLERIEQAYTGKYFENYNWPWAENERKAYSRQYLNVTCILSDIYLQNYEFEKAEKLLEKAIKINPYDEKPMALLMKTYIYLSNKNEAKRLYDEFCRTLKNDLGIKPSYDVELFYSSI